MSAWSTGRDAGGEEMYKLARNRLAEALRVSPPENYSLEDLLTLVGCHLEVLNRAYALVSEVQGRGVRMVDKGRTDVSDKLLVELYESVVKAVRGGG